ncbi:MAG: methylmalonyl-CoA mutase family protein [Spirochaetota bacterium]|nr:methylmalonyl-CoA mutase family protein [Spirochaetota bacterium]
MLNKNDLERLEEARRKYDEEVRQVLAKIPDSGKEHVTISGLSVKPLFSPLDIEESDFLKDISFPGQYPFTRSVFHAGYHSRTINIRQVTGIGTAEETNERWKFLLSLGATALAVVGLRGWGPDADDERMDGFVGKDEVVCDSLYDYETLFNGIDLRKYPVHLITGSSFALANYIVIAERQGIELHELRGSISNMLRPDRECLDIIEYCARNMPLYNAGYLDMRNTREGGCTAAQEIAFGVALTMATVDELINRGLKIDDFLHRITWFVNSGPEFFEEVAKFRTLRRIWARTFRERYGVTDPRSLMARMHCQTYAPTLTKCQPFNNLIRSTIYALAAIMGGVQSIHINSFDEAFATPTEFSSSLSVRTQQIIDLETGITSVIDPLGGSYYIEWLTNKIEEDARNIIDTIQSKGGAFKAFNWMQDELRKAALRWQEEIDSGRRLHVGVNTLVDEYDIQMEAFKVLQEYADFQAINEYNPSIRDKQIRRLNKVRSERDDKKVEMAKERLLAAYKSEENILPPMIKAVKCYITQGEVGQVMAKSQGYSSMEEIFNEIISSRLLA